MSVYPPPNFEEYLSVFNPANWIAPESSGVDIAYLDANYLRFPTAQGTENLLTTNVSGTLTTTGEVVIRNTNNKIKFNPPSANTNLIIAQSSNTLMTATSLGASNSIIGDTVTGKTLAGGFTGGCNNNTAVGSNALAGTSNSSDYPSYNTAVGYTALQSLNGTGFFSSLSNTAIGNAALFQFTSGNNNSGIGYASGIGLVTGSGNSFIGANSGTAPALAGNCNNSIVIGESAQCTASNQVYIGGSSTSCVLGTGIPLTFEGAGTSLINGVVYAQVNLAGVTTYAFPLSGLGAETRFTNSAQFTVNLNSTGLLTPAIYWNRPFWLSNASSYTMQISAPAGQAIQGKYGSGALSLAVEAGGVIGLYFNGTNFFAFYKDSGSTIITPTTINITNGLKSYQNSIIRLVPTADQTITLPNISASTSDLWGGVYIFNNQSAFNSTLTCSTTIFTGQFGSRTTSYIIYPFTSVVIQPNQTLLSYDIITRTLATITRAIAYSGTAITLTYNDLDSVIDLTGSVATTVNLPNPTIASNPFIKGRSLRIFNDGSALISISSPSGNITGSYGSGATTISLQDNTWYNLTSNGTTWDINERSSNITFNQSITANANFSAVSAYTDATLRIDSTGAFTVTIPSPSTATTHATTSKYVNVSGHVLTLSIGSGLFTGKYGTGANVQFLPPNAFIEVYSDGANYQVQDRSQGIIYNRYLNPTSPLDLTSNNTYLDATLELNTPDNPVAGSALALSGNATQAGTVLTIGASPTGIISAGSVITLNSVRMIVYAQLSGTFGAAGTYAVSCKQTVGTLTAYTGFGATATIIRGLFTESAFSSQNVNQADATLTIQEGGNNLNAGTSVYATGQGTNITYLLNNANSGGTGTYKISSAPSTALSGISFFATKGGKITLPDPSVSLRDRNITIVNNAYIPTCIVNTSGTAVFAGQYGQQLSSALGTAPAANASQYLLMPRKTVVLQCDGTTWNAVTGTTVDATKVFQTNAQATGAGDNTSYDVTTIYPSNCYDGGLNALQFSNDGAGNIVNTSNVPLTLLVTARVTWASAASAASTALHSRFIGISCGSNLTAGALTNFTQPVGTTTNTIFQTLVAGNFTPVGSQSLNQVYTQIVTLNYNDSFKLVIGKLTGTATTESLATGYITCQRLY